MNKNASVLEYALSRKVVWKETVKCFGKEREVDLDHTLKLHLDNNGLMKVLVQKALTKNLKLHLTGHLNT